MPSRWGVPISPQATWGHFPNPYSVDYLAVEVRRIHVKRLEGHTTEQQRQLAKALTEAIVEICGAKPESPTMVMEQHTQGELGRGGVASR